MQQPCAGVVSRAWLRMAAAQPPTGPARAFASFAMSLSARRDCDSGSAGGGKPQPRGGHGGRGDFDCSRRLIPRRPPRM